MIVPAHTRKTPLDQAERDAAVTERDRNVIVNAGAGTGKTSILVSRFVEMVAPTRSTAPAVPIARVAAITFTRKAAGELRFRIRERLLAELARVEPHSPRKGHLRDAMAGFDTAYVGTIHSFADRLLRLQPVKASLSPSYEIAEDDEPLIHETFQVLLQAAESGTLAAELEDDEAAARADEATRTILDALSAGLQAETWESEYYVSSGLDALVRGFIRQRDVPPPPDAPQASIDFGAFRKAADEFIREAAPVVGKSIGAAWIARTAEILASVRNLEDPIALYRNLGLQLRRSPKSGAQLGRDFGDDATAWRVWKLYCRGDKKLRPTPLRNDLRAPLERWMASCLVRLFPVVVALYEKVKARHRQLDQLDLLLKLRNLLKNDRDVRTEFQRMFGHIFVDEFQDTDPLQAEIVLFLCENGSVATRWEDVSLAAGKLTVVGDAKQSIYRFRRADVAMYDRVLRVVGKTPHLPARLSANFRSVPSLIDWFNDRFRRIHRESQDAFDPVTGRVFHQPLAPGRDAASSPSVHVLNLAFSDGEKHKVDEYRALEGRALARYFRWLTETDAVQILDPFDERPRKVRYGDIAVLATSTWSLPHLFQPLDHEGIPYASRGGVLFLKDQLHRQFLLGLRAIADRDDGVAMAALLRPPFFAVDPADLLREQAATRAKEAPVGDSALRAREARDLVVDLRRRRSARPPGATARDLLERTAFARNVASGPNGTQRLARLRELCLLLEQRAAEDGLDYDAATALMRDWVDEPVQLDPPHPVGAEAVQILTIHQAKGLEFPVVVIWDGKGLWTPRLESAPWRMERDGRGWMMDLQGLTWEEPSGLGIRKTELDYQKAERERVAYVAATRARDLLIVPKAGDLKPGTYVCSDLLAEAPSHLVNELEPYADGHEPAWATQKPPTIRIPKDGASVEQGTDAWWTAAAAESARPRFRPASVSGETQFTPVDDTQEMADPALSKPRKGRFGPLFGTTVHHAIGLVLRDSTLTPEEAARVAAQRFDLQDHLSECIADVTRALESLQTEGLVRPLGSDLQVEYPVAAAWEGGQLLGGYIDLVSATDGRLDVLDFKTDTPPPDLVEQTYPGYVAQVRAYGRLLETTVAQRDRSARCGLLFTGDGGIRWV